MPDTITANHTVAIGRSCVDIVADATLAVTRLDASVHAGR